MGRQTNRKKQDQQEHRFLALSKRYAPPEPLPVPASTEDAQAPTEAVRAAR
jgi:hypothetical protein